MSAKTLKSSASAVRVTLAQWLRLVRDDLRASATKREIPGRTAAPMRARAHLRKASRWVTAAIRALEEGRAA